ncbi:hypothetical protein PGO_080000 [Plasmodium gonderi]|uniref:Uncharacterized protein n=1 Tax=Plasmodium gonderi TaxID=77519 RepID=A0A1Y1JD73_PLAGO|nr:hypothetical protein PGO_080000 [Plasmodium gonderi]GAW80436.1 hypothetical protein PGO_080000 [Plasmodium gonderi]
MSVINSKVYYLPYMRNKKKKFHEHCAAEYNCFIHTVSNEQQNVEIISKTEETCEQNKECKENKKKEEDSLQSVRNPEPPESISSQSTGPAEEVQGHAYKKEPKLENGPRHSQSDVTPSENNNGSHNEVSQSTNSHHSSTTDQAETGEKTNSPQDSLKTDDIDSIQSCLPGEGSNKSCHPQTKTLNTQQNQTETHNAKTLGNKPLGEETTPPKTLHRKNSDNEAVTAETSDGFCSTEKGHLNDTGGRNTNSVSTPVIYSSDDTTVRPRDVASDSATASDRKSASTSRVTVSEDQASNDDSRTTIHSGASALSVHTNGKADRDQSLRSEISCTKTSCTDRFGSVKVDDISRSHSQRETHNQEEKQQKGIVQSTKISKENFQTNGASEQNLKESLLQKSPSEENSVLDPMPNSHTITGGWSLYINFTYCISFIHKKITMSYITYILSNPLHKSNQSYEHFTSLILQMFKLLINL